MDPKGDFIYVEVEHISQWIFNAKYRIVSNGSIIKVRNSTHIRLVEDQSNLPETFKILAPMDAVSIKSGNIPDHNIQEMRASDYISIRKRYLGH